MKCIEMDENRYVEAIDSLKERIQRKEAAKVLIGEYYQNIDDKGRINIPSKFRHDLGETFVVAKGLDDCVSIYPKSKWDAFLESLMAIPPSQRRALQRYFGSGAEECTIDSQGRVVIPPKLRLHADLQKEIAVVGDTEKVEVWNRQVWEEYISGDEFETDHIAQIMEELGM